MSGAISQFEGVENQRSLKYGLQTYNYKYIRLSYFASVRTGLHHYFYNYNNDKPIMLQLFQHQHL